MSKNLLSLIRKSLPNKDDQQLALEILEEEGLDVSGDTVVRIVLLLVKFMRGLEASGVEIGSEIAKIVIAGFVGTLGKQIDEIGEKLSGKWLSDLTYRIRTLEETASEILHSKWHRRLRDSAFVVGMGLVVCCGCWIWNATLRTERDKLREEVVNLARNRDLLASFDILLVRNSGTDQFNLYPPPDAIPVNGNGVKNGRFRDAALGREVLLYRSPKSVKTMKQQNQVKD